jgi:hypothetical protein
LKNFTRRNIFNADESKPRLAPDRIYKENRSNWNGNYLVNHATEALLPKQASVNWSPWYEHPTHVNRSWSNNSGILGNGLPNQRPLVNGRRISAKLPPRYVIAQSPSQLPSRYPPTFRYFRRLCRDIIYDLRSTRD